MGQIIVALSAIALAATFWAEAADYPATAAKLPNLLGWVVLILAALAIVQVLVGWRRQRADGTLDIFPEQDWRGIGIGAGFLGLVLLYAWSITEIGYLIATPLFIAIPLAVLRPIGVVPAILTTVGVTSFIWGVFVWFLNLSIPLYPAF